MEYEELLKKAYGSIKVVEHNGDRFEIPRAVGEVSGSNTFISNINVDILFSYFIIFII